MNKRRLIKFGVLGLSLISIVSLSACNSAKIDNNVQTVSKLSSQIMPLGVNQGTIDLQGRHYEFDEYLYGDDIISVEYDDRNPVERPYYGTSQIFPAGLYILDIPVESEYLEYYFNCDSGNLYYTYYQNNDDFNCIYSGVGSTVQNFDSALLVYADANWNLRIDVNDPIYIEHYRVGLLTFTATDYQAPSINGTVNLSVNVENQPSIETILSNIKAIDDTDGEVELVVESKTYDPGVKTVGTFNIVVSATDRAGNKATQEILIHRYDDDKPVISGTNSYTLNYDHDLTLEKIKAALSVSDNVDSNLQLNLVSDNFSANKNITGSYQVVFNATDKSNNTSDNYIVNIEVQNQGTPVISAPGTIEIGTSQVLSLDVLKQKISVVDGYDGKITSYDIIGYDNYASNSKVVGTYTITISYTNSGGHSATATIKIITSDTLAPDILFNSYFTLLKQGESLSIDTLTMICASVFNVEVDDIVSIDGEYDTSKVGQYDLKVNMQNGDVYDYSIKVLSADEFEEKTDYEFSDYLPGGKYWQDLSKDYSSNWGNVSEWNWAHYTTVIAAALLVMSVVLQIINKKKR